MEAELPAIVVVEHPIERSELARLVSAYFGDMVKLVVDVRREVVAVGGELHADAEQLLLEQGSRQANLWGANYYPGRGAEGCLQTKITSCLASSRPTSSASLASCDEH